MGEVDIQESEHEYSAFAIRQRNDLCFDSFTVSPVYLMGLGLVSAIMSIVCQLASLLDVKKDLSTSFKSAMEGLVNSRIDFAPIEISTSNKTTVWICIDYMRLCKFTCCIFMNVDRYIAEKNHNSINTNNCNSKR